MAMGTFKKENFIINLFLICFLFLINCNNIKKEDINVNTKYNKPMDKNLKLPHFDVEKYEANLKRNPLYEGYQKDKNTYVRQSHGIKDGYIEETYTKSLVTNYVEQYIGDDRFETFYIYDNNGNLRSISHYFADNLEIGKLNYYKNDILVKTQDKDENYPFSLEKVLKYGKDNHVDFTKTGMLSRSYSKTYGTYIWDLNWNTGKKSDNGEKFIFKKEILDGNSGKVLLSKEYHTNLFQR